MIDENVKEMCNDLSSIGQIFDARVVSDNHLDKQISIVYYSEPTSTWHSSEQHYTESKE